MVMKITRHLLLRSSMKLDTNTASESVGSYQDSVPQFAFAACSKASKAGLRAYRRSNLVDVFLTIVYPFFCAYSEWES